MKRYLFYLVVCVLTVVGVRPSAAQDMYTVKPVDEFSPKVDTWELSGLNTTWPIDNLVDGNMGTEIRGHYNKNSIITFSPSTGPVSYMLCRTASDNINYHPTGIMVESSADNQNWKTEYDQGTNQNQKEWVISFANPIPADRYIRVTFRCSAAYQAFIWMNELTFSSSSSSADFTIHHKRAKWHSRRGLISNAAKAMDSFSDGEEMFRPDLSSSDDSIQAAHTYIDTLYVHKGDAVNLYLPDVYRRDSESDISNFSVSSYQRWYSYRTGMTFELPHKDDSGTNVRYDLLTPLDGQTIYRFANGYVGQPVNTIGNNNNLASAAYQMQFYYPTDEEFNHWIGAGSGIDNNWYVVACDVSSYTDFTPDYTDDSHSSTFFPSSNADGKVYEPTLTHRVVFYIVGVDGRENDQSEGWVNGFGRLKNEAYRNDIETDQPDSKKYLEEYEITFSARRVSNKTLDLVALSKDAGSYAIPDAENDDSYDQGYKNISVSLVDNTAGIILADERFSKPTLRTIRFSYPKEEPTDGTQYVNDTDRDGVSHATILVTKKAKVGDSERTYNLARYRLTFIDEVQPLTQTQVDEIEKAARSDTATLDKYWNYAHRTPEYMESNYQLLTSMAWDFDTGVAGEAGFGSNSYYPFPLGWERSSYSFYDGSNGSNFSNNNKFPEWGYYAVTSTYVDFDNNWHHGTAKRPQNEPSKGSSTFHIYVDASDRPGIVTRLPFEQNLCRGSELFVSAWVKSAVSAYAAATQTNNEDACLLFTIMGVRTVTSGGRTSQVYTPIYRYSTGQLHSSTFLSDAIPGCGKGKADQWFQVYFTFINEQENSDYDSYVLQVENNSYSTSGGDFYLDDVRVYMVKPRADVVQLRAGCAGERTLMSARIDWDRLSSRLGHEDTDKGVEGIDFVFVDQTIYNNFLAEHPEKGKAAALVAAAAMIGPEKGSELYDKNHGTLYFKYPFSENTEYDGTAEDPDLAKDNMKDGKAYFYRRGTPAGGNRELVVDFFSDLQANRPYWMLIRVHDDDNGTELLFDELAAVVDDSCAIKSDFWVTAETLLKMNGETVKPGTNYCAGQILDFSAQVRIPYISKTGEEKYISVNEGVYFDWFFGTEEAFYKEYKEHEDSTSVQSALTHLRDLYPDAAVVSEEATPVRDMFTQADYDLLHDLSTREPGAGSNPPLVLRRAHLNIELLETGLQLVIQPITTLKAPGSIELPDDVPLGLDSLWSQVCWAPVPMTLQADGKSPTVHAGFNRYNYPDPAFDPNLRIGLAQIKSTTSKAPLRIDLRGATFSVDNPDPSSKLVPLTSNKRGRLVYLIGTNDPEYEDIVNSPDFSQYAYPIGYVDDFLAQPYEQGSAFNDHVSIRFYLKGEGEPKDGFVFHPKEGYWYTFSVHFEELLEGETSTACYGKFALRMNVVPEYLVWNGGPTNNWNRDENWLRVNKAETIYAASDSFLDGNTTDRAFVPMLFSKVLIPKGKQVQLYRAGWRTGSDGHYGWESQRPEWMQSPTDSIQYDLMAYDDPSATAVGKLVTKPYRVALCKEIHFEPGAEMLHAEYLLTERVWTDVEVPARRWTPVSTPLQDVYAGDWYTQTSGSQATEYFRPITFDDSYDRLKPAVYQRSWNADAAKIVENAQGTLTPVSFKMAVWSSAFNDASVPYSVGSGFSLKHGFDGVALFRLPKDDALYSVATNTGALDRDSVGVLKSTVLVERNPDMEKTEIKDYFTAELTPSADGCYYIVGNPFVAQMDVAKFLAANSDVLQPKCWMTTAGGDPLTAAADAEGGWTTSDGSTSLLLPPYGAFYAEAVEGVTGPVTVKFYGEHQQLKDRTVSGTGTTQAAALTVSCASAAGTSTAAVCCTPDAADGFGVGDVQLVRGLTADVSQPTVYTVAGATAVTVDSRGRGGQVPLGVYAPDGMVSTLTFTGVAALEGARLYDAQTRSERTLHEGDAVTVDGPSHGRYFLRFDGAGTTGIATTTPAAGANIYSVQPGEIIVAATETLTGVDVYTTDGRHVRSLRPADVTTLRIGDLPAAVYVVRAATDHATANAKVSVR